MGEVHRATDERLGRQLAIKLMRPVPQTLAAAERFQREARALARIRSPHVVAAYDFGTHGAGYYLAMELVGGNTVADELKRKGLFSPERAEHIIRQAAAGLAAIHQLGIVHRDIKPGNLLLSDDGTVKIADFGIVSFLHDATTTLTSTGQIVGTSAYLAPERARGKPAGPASDIYALGCVLYQLVTGHPPFMADQPASLMYQHVQSAPIPPSELRPELDGDVEALALWMLAKDPAARPTADEVASGVRPVAVDDAITSVLPVRRKPVLAGAAAGIALAVSAALGIVLDTQGMDLPATDELNPNPTIPAVVPTTPSTSRAVVPTTKPPSTRSTTASELKPSTQGKPGKAKAGEGSKEHKSKSGKSKKPKS
ncbi:serine/threonine-protein kinase [Kribbella antiqua]|uniref:non-specific serine/threonine protein kinase n=2 Tax=Kribbella antiqua TaxID=2512217 RepID=A0A4R2J392_9ACTN|nr:serine/threonine-protein kinase [Kribbella antiqua]